MYLLKISCIFVDSFQIFDDTKLLMLQSSFWKQLNTDTQDTVTQSDFNTTHFHTANRRIAEEFLNTTDCKCELFCTTSQIIKTSHSNDENECQAECDCMSGSSLISETCVQEDGACILFDQNFLEIPEPDIDSDFVHLDWKNNPGYVFCAENSERNFVDSTEYSVPTRADNNTDFSNTYNIVTPVVINNKTCDDNKNISIESNFVHLILYRSEENVNSKLFSSKFSKISSTEELPSEDVIDHSSTGSGLKDLASGVNAIDICIEEDFSDIGWSRSALNDSNSNSSLNKSISSSTVDDIKPSWCQCQ